MLQTLKIIIILLALASCTTTTRVEKEIVKDTVLKYLPSAVIDSSLYARSNYDSTLLSAIRTRGNDTIIDVRYYPQEKRFYVKVQPDTVRILYRDTTNTVTTIVQPTQPNKKGFFDNLKESIIYIVVAVWLVLTGWWVFIKKHGAV